MDMNTTNYYKSRNDLFAGAIQSIRESVQSYASADADVDDLIDLVIDALDEATRGAENR